MYLDKRAECYLCEREGRLRASLCGGVGRQRGGRYESRGVMAAISRSALCQPVQGVFLTTEIIQSPIAGRSMEEICRYLGVGFLLSLCVLLS